MTVKKTQQALSTTLEKTEQALDGLENVLENNVGGSSLATGETNGLPEGWVLSALGILANRLHQGINTSADKVKYVVEGMKILQAKHITSGVVNYVGAKELGDADVEKYVDRYKPLKNHILFTNIGTIGRSIVLKQDADYLIAWNIFLISASTSINPQLLKQYLDFLRISGFYETLYRGGATQFINKKQLSGLRVPLPPLAEQTVIAQTLDSLLAQVDNIKTRLDAIPKILKTFRQSVLAAAVSGKLTEAWRGENECVSISKSLSRYKEEREELKKAKKLKKSFGPKSDAGSLNFDIPDSWEWVTFEHIARHDSNALKAGPFGSALKKSDCVEKGYRVYGQEQVIAGDESLVTYHVTQDKFNQLESCSVKEGDILISLVGTIGKVLVLSDSCEKGIINPRLVKLSLQTEINREFIKSYINSTFAHDFFKGFSHGGTMEILNLGILKELPIPLPPVEEQTEIVRRVEELFAFADQIEQQVKNAQGRVNNLTQSILAKAFRGELTAQWRVEHPDLITGDNSAEALLAKIQAERDALKKSSKPKKKSTAKKATRKKTDA